MDSKKNLDKNKEDADNLLSWLLKGADDKFVSDDHSNLEKSTTEPIGRDLQGSLAILDQNNSSS